MATIEELAARVERLEEDYARIRELRLDVGLGAQAYGLSLVHSDTQHLLAEMGEVKGMVAELLARIPKTG